MDIQISWESQQLKGKNMKSNLKHLKFFLDSYTYQAIQLTDGAFVARLRDVPHFDASFAAGIHVFRWVGYRDSANDFAVR